MGFQFMKYTVHYTKKTVLYTQNKGLACESLAIHFFVDVIFAFQSCSCFVPSKHATIQFATSVYEIGPQISIVSY